MKIPTTLYLVASILHLIFLSSCPPISDQALQESFFSVQWPGLKNYSDIDNFLGSFVETNGASNEQLTHFQSALKKNLLSQNIIDKLTELLQATDIVIDRPGYHGYMHSARVGNLTASVMDSPCAMSLSENQKIMFIIAALFHDVDPERDLGTPPKVTSTFKWMEKDQRAIALFADIENEKRITKEQIKTVIKFTDFDLNPEKLAAIKQEAITMTELNFDEPNADVVKLWGPNIAYFDQVAMYVGSFEFAVYAVVGLASEVRAIHQYLNDRKGTLGIKVTKPTDAQMLSNTADFLNIRIKDSSFRLLPEALQNNFRSVHKSFETTWTGRKYVN